MDGTVRNHMSAAMMVDRLSSSSITDSPSPFSILFTCMSLSIHDAHQMDRLPLETKAFIVFSIRSVFCMTNAPFLLAIASDSDFAVYPLFLGVKETTYA